MAQYFAADFAGKFHLFGTPHLIAITILAIVNASFFAFRGRWNDHTRRRIEVTLAIVIIFFEVAWQVWSVYVGWWRIQIMLPFHLCNLMMYLAPYMLLTHNYRAFEFVYFLGIGGALQGVITPAIGDHGFPHFLFFQAIIAHGAVVTAGIYMAVVQGYRPTWQSFKRVIIIGNIYMVFVAIIDWAIGANYMFLAQKPDSTSLMDALGPHPWYILSLEGIALLVMLLLYLPYIIKDRRKSVAS